MFVGRVGTDDVDEDMQVGGRREEVRRDGGRLYTTR